MNVAMPLTGPSSPDVTQAGETAEQQLRLLFHRLNNQLGIILAHAELLEAKATDDVSRARAEQVVTSALDAMGTARAIRQLADEDAAGG